MATSASSCPFDTIGEALRRQAATRPGSLAVAFAGNSGRLTYAELHDRAEALARGLLSRGIQPQSHVALLAQNRIEWVVSFYALALAGLVCVPLNSHLRSDDLKAALGRSRATAILASRAFRSNPYYATISALAGGGMASARALYFDGEGESPSDYDLLLAEGAAHLHPLPAPGGDALAGIYYSSGTTGVPKGVMTTHRGVLCSAYETAGRLGLTERDRWISMIPLFHAAGSVMNLLGCLTRGACYVGVEAFDASEFLRLIEEERCTFVSGVPTTYAAMFKEFQCGGFDLSSLRVGTCGGADTDPALLRRYSEGFPLPGLCQVYGQTESSGLITCPRPADDSRFATAGPPLDGLEIKVVDPRSAVELPSGKQGQIMVRGEMVMRGYFEMPKETAETLGEDGWLATGDLGHLTPEGDLVIGGGRLRDMIIRGGENIYPFEVENFMRGQAGIDEIAVFGLPDDHYGEIVGAAVRLATSASREQLRSHFRGKIARYKVPERWFLVEEFPMTASGKIRKVVLRQWYDERRLIEID